MRVVVIGGTGHVGTYLVPRLVRAGHEVVVVSRGEREPYRGDGAWRRVERVELDRERAEREDRFAPAIADLDPDAVVDMICFTRESAERLVDALAGTVDHLLHCGTIWVHGHSRTVPTTEDAPRDPHGEYGRRKAAIESFLLGQARRGDVPATVLHPGHIVGPGWLPLNPQANFQPDVYERLAAGERVVLPNSGLETVHHVHADDVAAAFQAALGNWSGAVGEAFHVVAPRAVTLRGYAEAVADWFGVDPDVAFEPLESWRETVDDDVARTTVDHAGRSPHCSIEKARRSLGYDPRYGPLEAVREALRWQVEHGDLDLPSPGEPVAGPD
jgi:nucleoside-diphosphate-sugar epimerase